MKRLLLVVLAVVCNVYIMAQSLPISNLISQASIELEKGNHSNAQTLYENAMKQMEASNLANTADYATCLHNIGRCFGAQQNISDGKLYTKKAVDLRKKLFGELNDDYILSLNNYANFCCLENDYKSAWKYQKEVIRLCEKLGRKHPKTFLIYDNMARYCVLADDANNCLKYWEVALSCIEKYSKDYENIMKMLDTAAASERITDIQVQTKIMQLVGDYNDHESLRDDLSPEEMPDAANWQAIKGNIERAREIYSRLLKMDLTPKEKKKAESSYALFCYEYLKDPYSSAEHYIAASDAVLYSSGKDDDYNRFVYMAYLSYKLAQNPVMAENCRLRAQEYIDNQEKKNAEKKNNQTKSIEEIADEHLRFNLDYLAMRGKYIGEMEYATMLGSISGCYSEKGDFENAVNYAEKYIVTLRNALRGQFRTMDYNQRKALWKEENFNIENVKELFAIVKESEHKARMSALMFDLQLLSKGILLNSAISFSNVIDKSKDAQLKSDYALIISLQEDLETLRKKGDSETIQSTIIEKSKSLEHLQLSVYQRCAEIADYTDYMSYNWQDVQKTLKNTDVAIEFALIGGPDELIDFDKAMRAFILTKEMKQPICVSIGKYDYLRKILITDDAINNSNVGNAVWGEITTYLRGKKRIFFSADKLFNNIGIEYLNVNGKSLCEQYEMYRLSSTKELCVHHKSIPIQNIVLIGGIDYGQMANSISDRIHEKLNNLRGMRESEAGFENLPFTKQEIENLNGFYKSTKPLLLMEQEATENTFRLLDNKSVTMLHISTHGSYVSFKNETEQDAMENSIMALSGANLDSSDQANDGIISAADIAMMNLRQCDMAVLSACQTGLGKQSDDGVFGLQRGFKNAGVHTLLITLSSVYDESTAMLMEQFHKNLSLNKMTKYKALVSAQKYLKEHGYSDPKYWASFILLDGID